MNEGVLDNILPIITTLLVFGGIWIVFKTIFKITMKVFMIGCLGIILFSIFSMVVGSLGFQ